MATQIQQILNAHTLEAADILEQLEVDGAQGLSKQEAEERQEYFGPNELPREEGASALRRFLEQFADPLVGALLVAAVIAAGVAVGEKSDSSWLVQWSDPIAILLIVFLNAVLGFVQEGRAAQALDALQEMASPTARVRREGHSMELAARELVPGDLVELEAGDSIPADLRILESAEAQSLEAALTGESVPVAKKAKVVLEEETSLADRENMLYSATNLVHGQALGIVVATGAQTQVGQIGNLVQSVEKRKTPLQERLAVFSQKILLACLFISVALFLLGLIQGRHEWSFLLLIAVSLAVAAIPEGLPAITTITLALGMRRMAQVNVLIRRLSAVETLGSADVICSDKTGTLTKNQMTCRHAETIDASYSISGEGYEPQGGFLRDSQELQEYPEPLWRLLRAGVICNHASVEKDEEQGWQAFGDPTEAALLVAGEKAGLLRSELLEDSEILEELPFDSDRKRMSVVVREDEGTIVYVKGSPGAILERCKHKLTQDGIQELGEQEREEFLERNREHAKKGRRVLALAERKEPNRESPETELCLLGLMVMEDPPRPEAQQAIEECRKAGVRVAMITGDQKLTAISIAQQLGIWGPDAIALHGQELDQASDEDLEQAVVFARVSPEQKLQIVRRLKDKHVVAMTGDGVNDAPALQEAQIGVAMGKTGTDVARQAAAMVLADDNFGTIVRAVREGRSIFSNIQKFIYFLLSVNAGLVFAVIVGSFFEKILPLTPLQLLWINLVTNGLPALALGLEPPSGREMERPPIPRDQAILSRQDLLGITFIGIVMGSIALSLFWLPAIAPGWLGLDSQDQQTLRCMAFSFLALSPLVHAWSCRHLQHSAFGLGWFKNRALWLAVIVSGLIHLLAVLVPFLNPVFETVPLTIGQWGLILGLSLLILPVGELFKWMTGGSFQAPSGSEPPSKQLPSKQSDRSKAPSPESD